VLKDVKSSRSAISWCRHEYVVDNQKSISNLKEADAPTHLRSNKMAPPTMKVLSLAMQTVTSKRTQQPEIVSLTGMSHESTIIDGPTSNPKDVTHFTIIRAASETVMPFDFKSTLKAQRKDTMILEESNERALLNRFITKLHKLDPDVIVGHGLHNNICEILVARMRVHNVTQWSKIGRLRKNKIPQAAKSSAFGVVDRGVACGRVMCDTQVSAQELVREKTYTLTHLAKQHLGVSRRELDDENVRKAFATSKDLIGYVNLMQNDAWLTLSLMHSLVVLPLTRQLTALCGNLWNRSLRSARAERVEYYLLHKFHSLKYIVPEKYTSKERLQRQLDEDRRKGIDPNETKANAARRKKKADYAGGLVLEPERGFYDQFVLLLDFNSLYPSIIQEYNICFTTVKHNEPTFDMEHGEMPDLPDSNAANGILPKVIKRLIDLIK
jgi:DNA polymerase alpha subunit A